MQGLKIFTASRHSSLVNPQFAVSVGCVWRNKVCKQDIGLNILMGCTGVPLKELLHMQWGIKGLNASAGCFFLLCSEEGSSSLVMFTSFHYLRPKLSGAHSGLSMCPRLTALLTFCCLYSANQVMAEMWIASLKSFCFSQVPLQFFDGTYGNVMSIWKSLCIICLYNCSMSPDKNSFLVIAHLLTKGIIFSMYFGTLPSYLTCLIM